METDKKMEPVMADRETGQEQKQLTAQPTVEEFKRMNAALGLYGSIGKR